MCGLGSGWQLGPTHLVAELRSCWERLLVAGFLPPSGAPWGVRGGRGTSPCVTVCGHPCSGSWPEVGVWEVEALGGVPVEP